MRSRSCDLANSWKLQKQVAFDWNPWTPEYHLWILI
jgi:hypothetical protein